VKLVISKIWQKFIGAEIKKDYFLKLTNYIEKEYKNTNNNIDLKLYTNVEKIKEEVHSSKTMFKKFNWPVIDVTRRSVEETAASIIKIYEIKKSK